jgi:nucleotide-binding universal stress UspA family protein
MIKNILVPTDHSINAHKAAKYAIAIAQKSGAKITFLNIYYLPTYIKDAPTDPVSEEILKQEANDEMEIFKKEHLSENIVIEMNCVLKVGNIVEQIVACANEINADLIVMGTKGASGVAEVVFGSNTQDVIEKTDIPVLAVPLMSHRLEFKNIIFATNYRMNDFLALEDLVDIAELFDATITVLHINDGDLVPDFEHKMLETFKNKVHEKIGYNNINFQLFESKEAFAGLNDFIHKNNIDLLAMSSRKKALYNRLFGKSISKKMVYHTHIPLMVFKVNEDDEITDF